MTPDPGHANWQAGCWYAATATALFLCCRPASQCACAKPSRLSECLAKQSPPYVNEACAVLALERSTNASPEPHHLHPHVVVEPCSRFGRHQDFHHRAVYTHHMWWGRAQRQGGACGHLHDHAQPRAWTQKVAADDRHSSAHSVAPCIEVLALACYAVDPLLPRAVVVPVPDRINNTLAVVDSIRGTSSNCADPISGDVNRGGRSWEDEERRQTCCDAVVVNGMCRERDRERVWRAGGGRVGVQVRPIQVMTVCGRNPIRAVARILL